MEDKRRYSRTQVKLKARIIHPKLGSVTFLTRDISHGGMFLVVGDSALPPVGDLVDVQILDVVDNPPMCKMKVVRLEDEGVGLVLCDEE